MFNEINYFNRVANFFAGVNYLEWMSENGKMKEKESAHSLQDISKVFFNFTYPDY